MKRRQKKKPKVTENWRKEWKLKYLSINITEQRKLHNCSLKVTCQFSQDSCWEMTDILSMHPLRILQDAAQSSQKSAELTATDGRNQVTTYFKAEVSTLKTSKKTSPRWTNQQENNPFYLHWIIASVGPMTQMSCSNT